MVAVLQQEATERKTRLWCTCQTRSLPWKSSSSSQGNRVARTPSTSWRKTTTTASSASARLSNSSCSSSLLAASSLGPFMPTVTLTQRHPAQEQAQTKTSHQPSSSQPSNQVTAMAAGPQPSARPPTILLTPSQIRCPLLPARPAHATPALVW